MAAKIFVVDPISKKPTGEVLKKTAALALIRRNLAEWHEHMRSLYRRAIREAINVLAPKLPISEPVPDINPPLEWYPGFGKWPKVHS